MNLVLNAREAMIPRGGKLIISAQADNEGIRIKISDTGCGIEQSELSRVFDTFFTTKHKKIAWLRHRPRPFALQKGYRRSRRNNNRRIPARQRYIVYNHPAEKIIAMRRPAAATDVLSVAKLFCYTPYHCFTAAKNSSAVFAAKKVSWAFFAGDEVCNRPPRIS